MNKTIKILVIAATLVFALGFAQQAKADNIQTLGEFNGPVNSTDPIGFQLPVLVGTFNFLAGDTSATISGTFGNSTVGSSSGVELFLGNILVGQCVEFTACYNGTTTWSDTLNSVQLALLGTGTVNLTEIQTSQFTVRLGTTTLDQKTRATTPEPSTMLLLGTGSLLFLGLAAKKLA